MIPLERNFSISDAEFEIIRVIKALHLAYDVEVVGEKVFAARCALSDRSGQVISSGLGKGNKASAIVGALFEAMEHYMTKLQFIDEIHLEYVNNNKLAREWQHLFSDVVTSVLDQDIDKEIACIRHQSLTNQENSIYPLGLFIPGYLDQKYQSKSLNPRDNYDYRRLGEYSSNSGVAIGMDRSEALLHGLLEASERDSISRFLFNTFIKGEPNSIQKMDLYFLPQHLRKIAEDVAEECSANVVNLYKLPNRFGIPTYCAWMDVPVYGLYQPGFGCSLSDDHAIERSLFELAQGYLALNKIHDKHMVETNQLHRASNLQKHRSLIRCLRFDMASAEELFGFTSVNYRELGHQFADRPGIYLQRALSMVQNGKCAAYAADFVFPIETKVKVTHTFITKSDRFMTVLGGRIPMPSAT